MNPKSSQTAYVVQDDVLYGFLTVQETLALAAHFHLPPAMGEGEKVIGVMVECSFCVGAWVDSVFYNSLTSSLISGRVRHRGDQCARAGQGRQHHHRCVQCNTRQSTMDILTH